MIVDEQVVKGWMNCAQCEPPQVISRFHQPGEVAHACQVVAVLHYGATFARKSWAATSDGQLVYVAVLLQVDGVAIGGKRVEVGHGFVKGFWFTFRQVRAELDGNSVCVPVACILQLLQLQGSLHDSNDSMLPPFSVPHLHACALPQRDMALVRLRLTCCSTTPYPFPLIPPLHRVAP
eukprot:6211762-Pleurochrysis_carterae.AAC.1